MNVVNDILEIAEEPIEKYFSNDSIIYREEAYKIIGACMEVHKQLGHGFLESVYKEALEIEFKNRNIDYQREKKYNIYYKDTQLSKYYIADFVIFDTIILEIKAQTNVIDENIRQVLNYLAVSKCKFGLIVNFGEESLKFKRIIL